MAFDKYGDERIITKQKLSKKQKKAFVFISILQILLIVVNVLILVVDFLNFYLCFATAPMYIFLYVHFSNAYDESRETMVLPAYLKLVKVISPLLYCLTAIPAIFKLF